MKWLLAVWLNLLLLPAFAQPSFKGGQQNLSLFIANNLVYPEYSRENCLQGTIEVSFKVDKRGRISDSKVQKGFGIDLDKEALRIIRLTSGKWIVPANYDTTSTLVIPINFALREYNCEQKSRDDIKAAITAYKAREDLTNAVFNFYESNPDQRTLAYSKEIENLKMQLGFDEKFVKRLLKSGLQKLKQGDRDGACEDFNFIKKIGSDKADKYIAANCR